MKRDAFVARGLRIETWREFDGRVFCCWKPDVSILCRTRKEVLRFAAWPVKTPTGDALRAQLDSWEAMDTEKTAMNDLRAASAEVSGVELSWDPQAHDVDNENTRMIT
jgi:hypothetical protein